MNAIKDVMMNKVLAGEAGKEKAREWGRWLAFEKTFCRTNSKSGSGDGTRCSCYSHITLS